MELLERKKFIDAVERVLHVKGNYTGGILEMTLVIDCSLQKDYVQNKAADLASVLRSHSEVFRNVRLNLLMWQDDQAFKNNVIPISFLQLATCFQDYAGQDARKSLDDLTAHLKLFHARSKLILVLMEGDPYIRNDREVFLNMQPFLGKKSLFLCKGKEADGWLQGSRLVMKND